MDNQGRIRVSFERNSRGYNYNFTLESTDEEGPDKLLEQAETMKDKCEALISAWTLALAEKQSEGA